MAALTIASRMPYFQLIAGITAVTRHCIQAVAALKQAPAYAGLEAMAQLAALHVRHSVAFERHAFLLKVDRCELPAGDTLDGAFFLTADVIGQSSQSFAYRVSCEGSNGKPLQAELLIGTRAYDRQFKRDLLESRYRKRFDALLKRGFLFATSGQTQRK